MFQKMSDKADRIYYAIFLLTTYVSHRNLNERLQYLGVDFLEMSYMFHPREREHYGHVYSEISFVLKELKSLTSGIVVQGILSAESKQLFDTEIDHFLSTLSTYVAEVNTHYAKEHGIVSPLFDQDFFGDNLDFLGLASSSLQSRTEDEPLKTSGKDLNSLTSKFSGKDLGSLRSFPENSKDPQKMSDRMSDKNDKDLGSPKSFPEIKKLNSIRHSSDNSQNKTTNSIGHSKGHKNVIDKDNRKKVILRYIQSKADVRLSDILIFVGNCSEKTIQRELNDLIEGGFIRKQGERRWSRYFFLKDIE